MARPGLNTRAGAALIALTLPFAAATAHAEGGATPTNATANPNGEGASTPQHLAQAFVQYGIAFTGEVVVAPGPICPATVECILGSGGGLALRVGWRLRAPFYIGAAYEFSKQEPQQLYRLAILQQARAEGRYYILTGHSTEPYLFGSVGAAGYGNLWGVDTAGPTFGVGAGAEFQLSTYLVIGLSMTYRAIFFTPFHDTAGVDRPAGFSHLLGVDLILETRDPF
jgi:hypothetical protein